MDLIQALSAFLADTPPSCKLQSPFLKGGVFFFAFFFGIFFGLFFWLLASGFWLLASGSFGFWLLACICCILEPKSLICVLFAAVWSQFACPFGFWLWRHLTLGFWFLFFVVFLALVSLGFWLLAALLLNVCVVLQFAYNIS